MVDFPFPGPISMFKAVFYLPGAARGLHHPAIQSAHASALLTIFIHLPYQTPPSLHPNTHNHSTALRMAPLVYNQVWVLREVDLGISLSLKFCPGRGNFLKAHCVGLQLKKEIRDKAFLKGNLTYTSDTLRLDFRYSLLTILNYYTHEISQRGSKSLFTVG